MNLSSAAVSAVILVSTIAGGCVVTPDRDASLTIKNNSSYLLTEVYIAETSQPGWGRNLTPGYLYPGESVVAYGLPCSYYDVLVVDETQLECTLYDLYLCFSDGIWYVTDSTLYACAFEKRLVPPRRLGTDGSVGDAGAP